MRISSEISQKNVIGRICMVANIFGNVISTSITVLQQCFMLSIPTRPVYCDLTYNKCDTTCR